MNPGELLSHNGVTVYRVFKEDEYFTRTFSFSTEGDGYEFGPMVFDVRDLPTWRGTGETLGGRSFYPISPEGDLIEDAVRAAIDQGLLPLQKESK